jgi:hypothetical protein
MTAFIPLLPFTTSDVLDLCLHPPSFHGQSVFICSYPKSGTTWTQNIVYQLLSDGNRNFDHISSFSPFYEHMNTWNITDRKLHAKYDENFNQLGYRIFNTHLRSDMLPLGDEHSKFIYVIRDGRDVVTSFYHHLSNQANDGGDFRGTFREFLVEWCAGTLPYGRWVDHIMDWYRFPSSDSCGDRKSSILFLRYEDMKSDFPATLVKIANHLGMENFDVNSSFAQNILEFCSFESMKTNKAQFQPVSVEWKEGYDFMRKGKVGDWSSLFGEEEITLYNAMIASVIDDPTVPEEMKIIFRNFY